MASRSANFLWLVYYVLAVLALLGVPFGLPMARGSAAVCSNGVAWTGRSTGSQPTEAVNLMMMTCDVCADHYASYKTAAFGGPHRSMICVLQSVCGTML